MEATLNLNNYTDKEILEMFGISEKDCQNKKKIKDQYNTIVENIKTQNEFTPDFKRDLIEFLTKALDRMIENLKQDYKLAESSFTPNLERAETFNNEHQVIKKNNKKSLTSLINPIRIDRISKLLNINTVFRENYYSTRSSDFALNLPAPVTNVIGVSLETAEIENTYYAFNSLNRTNEFIVEIYDVESANGQPITFETDANALITKKMKKIVTIKEGNYTGEELSDFLNRSLFSKDELARLACKYDTSTRKFAFFKDKRDVDDGGLPDTNLHFYRFNLDFKILDQPNREIQKNMGWLLGFRKQQYNFVDNYVKSADVSDKISEGFTSDATCNCKGTPYIYISVDCYNNNHSQSIISPFTESAFNDTSILAKLKNNITNFNYSSGGLLYGFKRDYFGPVTVSKMRIRILDQYGDIVDLHNNDFSFTLKFDQMYNLNINYSSMFD
ncbi:MAG: hypothetical protein CXT73_04390 [Methanobacteriota archaeon]|nr:MAG: hypothetical protein CXT73_04390 [Euryarchaeota archaeon]